MRLLLASAVISLLALSRYDSEGFVTAPDGVRLFYRTAGSARPVAVLLHGGPGSNINAVWPDLQDIANDRRIVMYDQRGGGRSEIVKDPKRLTARDHVRDLEALRATLGLKRFALVGESWGALLAVLYAFEHPDRVERLLLLGPAPPTRTMMNRRLDESDAAMGMRAKLAAVAREMPEATDPIATCTAFFDLYTRQFFAHAENIARRRGSSCHGPTEGVRNYFVVNEATFASLGDYDVRPQLAKLTAPTLVIEGERSIPSTVESARAFAAALPNAQLLLVADAGHYPQVERPDVFVPAVHAFLRAR